MSIHPDDSHLDDLKDHQLLERVRLGDPSAERVLFQRYYGRLVRFARAKMDLRLQRIEPPSDVAHSAMKSVLMGIPSKEFELQPSEALWPLLVTITLNKIRNRWRKNTQQRRDMAREVYLDEHELLAGPLVRESETEVADLVERLLDLFPERRRKIIERVLEGYGTCEIARELNVSERTVYSTRRQAAESLKSLLGLLDHSADRGG